MSTRPGDQPGDQPEPQTDPTPPEGPGGVDAVPDWEAAEPDPVTPDQPRSAQVEGEHVPDEIDEPEQLDEEDGAGSHPDDDPDPSKDHAPGQGEGTTDEPD